MAEYRYKALYKEFNLFKPLRAVENNCVEGNNKEEIRRQIASLSTEEKPLVWAIFNSCGECVCGGVVKKQRGESVRWDEFNRERMAKCFFTPLRKPPTKRKKT